MLKRNVGIVTAAITALTLGGAAFQEEKPAPPPMQIPSQEDMMQMFKKWQESTTPGKAHEVLDRLAGEWETTMRVWMAGPGMPPTETKGRSTVRWVLGRRFLQEEMTGKTMMPDLTGAMKAVPFEGIGLLGHDNYRNMYVGSWVDNMNTHMLTFRGTFDPSGKVFTAYGEMDEPMMNVTGRYCRYITRIISDDKHIFEIHDLHAGENYKVIEIVYERKK